MSEEALVDSIQAHPITDASISDYSQALEPVSGLTPYGEKDSGYFLMKTLFGFAS